MTTHYDPVRRPSHYIGADGLQVRDITIAYRLGPDLTQAVQYIIRAGRKTMDMRTDLAKAITYLGFAIDLAHRGEPLTMGYPHDDAPTFDRICASFDLFGHRADAVNYILGYADGGTIADLQGAIAVLDEQLAGGARPRDRLIIEPIPHRESA